MNGIRELLAELRSRGIALKLCEGQIWYSPRSAVTPGLLERLKAHKTELAALLRRRERGRLDRQTRPVLDDRGELRATGRPDAPAGRNRAEVPHELSLDERVATGYVPGGWSPAAWAGRLRDLAGRCEKLHPGRARLLERWAECVEQRHCGSRRTRHGEHRD